MKTLTYQSLVTKLDERRTKSAAVKSATAGSGAPGSPSVQVTEKDPQDLGTVAIPKDPNTAPKNQTLPGSGTDTHPNHNKDVTDVKPVGATAPKSTVTDGDSSVGKAAKVVASIQNFRATLKSAGSKAAESEGKMPVPAPAAEGKPVDKKDKKDEKIAEAKDEKKDKPAADKAADANGPIDDGKHPVVNSDKAAQGPKTDQVKGDKDPNEESKPPVREDNIGGIPDNADTNESTKGNENKDKAANVDFDASYHFKLASIVLANEDLRVAAEAKLQEAFGAEVAQEIVKAAATMENTANEMARLEAEGAAEAEELWKSASEAEKAMIIKVASIHEHARNKYTTDFEKAAYDMGAGAAAEEMDAPSAPPAGPEGAPAHAEPDGDITPEDLMAVLQQLVQSGEITPEIAQAIVEQISGGGAPEGAAPEGAPAPEGGLPPEAAGAPAPETPAVPEGAPAPEGAADEADKEAAALVAKAASVAATLA